MKYYCGDTLRNKKDKNNEKPEIFLVSGIRSAGKTTDFCSFLLKRFLKYKEQFVLIHRYYSDISHVAEAQLETARQLVCPDKEITSNIVANAFSEIFLSGECCGFVLPLSKYSKIKVSSPLFNNVEHMFFDEFQDQRGNYLPDELEAFKSIHTSVARGQGKQNRYVPVYMASNSCSILNPYFKALSIKYIQASTRFMRGDGWVLEIDNNQNAKTAYESSSFNRAFSAGGEVESTNNFVDDYSHVMPVKGSNSYLFSLKHNNNLFGCRFFNAIDVIYISKKADLSNKQIFAASKNGITPNITPLLHSSSVYGYLISYYKQGKVYYDSLESLDAFIALMTFVYN